LTADHSGPNGSRHSTSAFCCWFLSICNFHIKCYWQIFELCYIFSGCDTCVYVWWFCVAFC